MSAPRLCSVSGCRERVVGRKLCRKHYQAAWQRGEFENAPIPHRPRNRVVCPPEHKHEKASTCYIQHQCRCDPCMDLHNAMEARRRKLKAYGRFDTGLVDAEPVRAHMMMLAEFGIGYKQAARIAGIGVTPTRTIIWGRQDPGPRYGELQKRVKRETAEALLAVEPVLENLSAVALTPARGTVRRMQALMAHGWSLSKQAEYLDWSIGNLSRVRLQYERASARGRGAQVKVQAKTARAVKAMYEDLSNRMPPRESWHEKSAYSRTRRFAAERGWPLPMDWEAVDNDFDRPLAVRRSAA